MTVVRTQQELGVGAAALVTCPACEQATLEPMFTLAGVPAMCNVLYPTREAALNVPRGDLELAFCPACGLVRNTAFDPELLDYSAPYENSLHFSPAFQSYAVQLARWLTERHHLAGGRVLEVGCGSGDFLTLLAEASGAEALGFDPSHDPARKPRTEAAVVIHRRWAPPPGVTVDLACARHVLEHLDDPASLVADLRNWLGGPEATAYVEVPDGEYLLRETAVWDLIYEHPSSFTGRSLVSLFERHGFGVSGLGTAFGGQFRWIEAGLDPASMSVAKTSREDMAALARGFASAAASRISEWRERLVQLRKHGRVALWGAGTKGITFLNLAARDTDVDIVVDVNPRKRAKHVAGTGQRIVGPDDLNNALVDYVIVMNPVYEQEIADLLTRKDVYARLETV